MLTILDYNGSCGEGLKSKLLVAENYHTIIRGFVIACADTCVNICPESLDSVSGCISYMEVRGYQLVLNLVLKQTFF